VEKKLAAHHPNFDLAAIDHPILCIKFEAPTTAQQFVADLVYEWWSTMQKHLGINI
jgi:hypothetical protein